MKWRKRRNGPPVPCWFADKKATDAGYPVKYVNLSVFADRPTVLHDRCQRLQSEMLLWLSGRRDSKPRKGGKAGVSLDDRRKVAGHAKEKQTEKYDRDKVEAFRRTMKTRSEFRKNET